MLLNDLAAHSEREITLVLDDYHVITAEPIQRAMTYLVEHCPPQVHFILSTRSDPQLPLTRLRARGQLTELRAIQLQFGTEEASRFLLTVMELDLAPEDVLALQSRTEGWIAGLQLAALSLQERRDVQQFLADFGGSHRHIVDYLVEEVLSQQPEEVQSFLLHTSILDRLTGPLCDALLGHHDGEAMLEHLERANLFLVPLDERRQWYRYHQLFAEVLRVRLVRAIGKQEVAALYGRASAWFELNGFLKEAVEVALAAADFGRAAHLIEQVGPALLFRFEQATLLRWLARFPQERVFAHTTLCRFYAWGLFFSGAVDAYEAPLQQAERLARADGRSLGYVYALHAYVARFHTADASAVIAWGQAALLLLPEQEREMRSVMAVMVASSYRFTGEARAAWQMATEARASSEGAGYAAAIQGAMFELAEVFVLQGKLPQATQTYQELIKAIDPGPRSRWRRCSAWDPFCCSGMSWMQLRCTSSEPAGAPGSCATTRCWHRRRSCGPGCCKHRGARRQIWWTWPSLQPSPWPNRAATGLWCCDPKLIRYAGGSCAGRGRRWTIGKQSVLTCVTRCPSMSTSRQRSLWHAC